MAFRAKLDFDKVYWGVEEVPQLVAGDVEVPADCDLRPGAYSWDEKNVRFEPLAPSQVKKVETAPSLEQAFAELATMLSKFENVLAPLPPRVQAWLDAYNKTIDELGVK